MSISTGKTLIILLTSAVVIALLAQREVAAVRTTSSSASAASSSSVVRRRPGTADRLLRRKPIDVKGAAIVCSDSPQSETLVQPNTQTAVSSLHSRAVEAMSKMIEAVLNMIRRLLALLAALNPLRLFAGSSKLTRTNDHIECDIEILHLAPWKRKLLNETLTSKLLQNPDLHASANATHFPITPHLLYRYYASSEWGKKYHGRKVDEAIADTVEWRKQFGISRIDTGEIVELVKMGLCYTSGLDKQGRPIMYLKAGRSSEKVKENILKVVMYTVERADRMSVKSGRGEFVTVIDLEGYSLANSLPISMIKDALALLKKHYPYRLGGVFIVNSNTAFNLLWSLIRPILPRKVLHKTFVLGKKATSRVMIEKLGKASLEEAYGGDLKEDLSNVERYFSEGYWYKRF